MWQQSNVSSSKFLDFKKKIQPEKMHQNNFFFVIIYNYTNTMHMFVCVTTCDLNGNIFFFFVKPRQKAKIRKDETRNIW